jgi:hypothetical protein
MSERAESFLRVASRAIDLIAEIPCAASYAAPLCPFSIVNLWRSETRKIEILESFGGRIKELKSSLILLCTLTF